MTRKSKILLVVCLALPIVILNARWEDWSRFHQDTLCEQRFRTLTLFGVPVWRSALPSDDPFSAAYTSITGQPPDPHHWRNLPPDTFHTLYGNTYWACHAYGTQYWERRNLLAATFDSFLAGLPRDQAAARLARINTLLPPEYVSEDKLNYPEIDALRKQLHLKPLYTTN
ncbi:hypothetical protein BH09VER1_BH09VER1_44720 [soil metagenome]